ncbi:Uma2 family endonuclease [Streptomyces sp. R302]|uniref:Uma2 family endonuclease n=1 Tax=unclassified Streptomyces TaxID=2593676 RepID=UPI00145D5505|nr:MULTISPECIES: Uma2 family endonuclease [unclassified Streptomyces]NML50592.1 Uma2 family endonuclease [Streptomyces sp. R301]NML79583.1 Uma2 family endonuclease [Streptomyces sp. R302]
MSALPADPAPGPHWDELVRFWEESDWPEGSKVEIIDGIIVVTPPPAAAHNRIVEKVHRRLYTVVPDDWGVYETQGVAHPSRGRLYVPDLLVIPERIMDELEGGESAPLTAAELVVEVTSLSNASYDRLNKAAAYAEAKVPLYLLIDRFGPAGPTVTLYGEPSDVYKELQKVRFGEEIHLPAPFDLMLDTSVFPIG